MSCGVRGAAGKPAAEARRRLLARPPTTSRTFAGSNVGRSAWNHGSAATSFFTPSGKTGSICSFTHFSVSSGVIFRWVGHSASTSTKEKPRPSTWSCSAFWIAFLRPDPLLGVEERDALDVDGAVEAGDRARPSSSAGRRSRSRPYGARRRLLAHERRRRHLAAGHAVDGVVDEDDGDRDAELRGPDDLGEADGGEVAVALVGDDDRLGVRELVADGDGGGAAVRGLRVADVEVVVEEDGAADRGDGDRPVLDAELLDRLGEVLVGEAVAAARAVVRRVPLQPLAVGVALELLVEDGSCRHLLPAEDEVRRSRSAAGRTPPMWRRCSIFGMRHARVGEGEPQLVLELSVRRLDDDDPLRLREERARARRSGRARAVTGRKSPALTPFSRSAWTAPFAIRAGVPKATRSDLGVVAQVEVGALLDLVDPRVLLVQLLVPLLEVVLVELDRGDQVAAGASASPQTAHSGMPRLQHRPRQRDPPGHLAEVAVGDDDDRVPVA